MLKSNTFIVRRAPGIRAIACLTRSRSAVKGVDDAARSDADRRDPVGRLQPIDEAVDGPAKSCRAAEPDVGLIDHEQNQAAAGGVLVAGIARWQRRAGRLRRGDQRNPLRAHDLARPAVDLDDEVCGREIRDRLGVFVVDAHVEGGDLHRRPEDRRRWLRRRLSVRHHCQCEDTEPATTTRAHECRHRSPHLRHNSYFCGTARYPARARTFR